MKSKKTRMWYNNPGLESDIIISTRVRLTRNLASFPFPSCFKSDDKDRVNQLVLDAFNQFDSEMRTVSTYDYKSSLRDLLEDWGVVKNKSELEELGLSMESAVLMNDTTSLYCVLNCTDHIKMSCLSSGLDFRNSYSILKKYDEELQKRLQFAASYDFGYLTSSLKDVGTGMKQSAIVSLPYCFFFNKTDDIFQYVHSSGFDINPLYMENNSLVPYMYIISTKHCQKGSEIDQIASMESVCKYIAETERKVMNNYSKGRNLVFKDKAMKCLSLGKKSLLLSYKEALSIIFDMKSVLSLGLITGISHEELNSLFFILKDCNLNILYSMSDVFKEIEEECRNDKYICINRCRAKALQDAINNVQVRV